MTTARQTYYASAVNAARQLWIDITGDERVTIENHVAAGAAVLSMLATWGEEMSQNRYDVIDGWCRKVIDVDPQGLTDSDRYEIAGAVACAVKFLWEAPVRIMKKHEYVKYDVPDDVIMAAVKEQMEEEENTGKA